MDWEDALDAIAILAAFAGSWLSLRSLFVSRIKDRLFEHSIAYTAYDAIPFSERALFRIVLNLQKSDDILFMKAITSQEEKERLESFYNFWEPARAFLWFSLALLLQLIKVFIT